MHSRLLKRAAVGLVVAGISLASAAQSYKVTNLVSDGSVPAVTMDANFINPWAISASGTWWISAANTGFNYVVASTGATANTVSFKVIVPAASGQATAIGAPAGSVTTGGSTGMILPNGTKASFIFSTLDGTISGWNSKLGTANAICQIAVNNSAAGASYPGLAILNVNATTSYVLAANFGTGNAIEVYDSTFKPTKLAGSFVDPNLPAGYAPFSVHVIGTQVFVNYALRTTTAPYRTVAGAGNGIVSAFDVNGNFVARVVTGGNLNAPWGIAFAPANFGIFSNDLLVGNFGDGKINVYDPKTFSYIGQLMDPTGKSLSYASLWELLPGGTAVGGTTAVSGGDTSTVYFSAGLANEAHGLLAAIANGTTAGSTPTYDFTASTGATTIAAGGSGQFTYSIAPANGFTGTVTLACSGLPTGSACTFSPAQPAVSATAVTTGTVTIQTTKAAASLVPPLTHSKIGSITTAMLLPLSAFVFFRRRKSLAGSASRLNLVIMMLISLLGGAMLLGCADNSGTATAISTPTGQSTVTMTATSGSVTQQTSLALNVQ